MDLINEKRTLTTLRLTDNQKKVMTRIVSAPTEKLSAEQISKGRGIITARELLVKLGMIESRDGFAAITPEGQQLMTDYNLTDETGQLTDEGNEFAFDEEDQPMPTESLLQQVNVLAEGRMKELDMDVKELLKYARTDVAFIKAKEKGKEKEMKAILADLMGKVGVDPGDDHITVAFAMAKLLRTNPEKYMD
jgi:hypothetical protein